MKQYQVIGTIDIKLHGVGVCGLENEFHLPFTNAGIESAHFTM